VNNAAARTLEALAAGNRLRDRYEAATVLGTFVIELPTPRTIRALGLAGFEFVVLDLEHSPFGFDTLPALVAEAQACSLPVLVRVWGHDAGLIGKVLDTGANGVMVPRIARPDQAEAIVAAARYAPRGERGMSPLISYSASPRPQATLDNNTIVVLQIEGRAAVQNSAEIAKVEGIDCIFIGPYDLSQSLGKPGDVHAKEVLAAAETVAAGIPAGVMLGTYVDDPLKSEEWAEKGFRFQCVSFDGRMLLEGAQTVFKGATR
jgi:4-hydroxy-2-oxoheptanedioate aldolase